MSDLHFVCSECGNRHPQNGSCTNCGDETLHDLRNPETRYFLEEIEVRLINRRENRLRMVYVAFGMLTVFGLWLIPGFWDFRRKAFAIPFLLDQIVLMAVIAYGASLVIDKLFPRKPRFPFLKQQPDNPTRDAGET